MEAMHLGQMKNRFDILDAKQNMIRPKKLRDFLGGTVGVDELALTLGKSRAALYRESIKLSKDFIEKHLIPIVWAADIAYELFEGDKEKARSWMLTPNSYFFGKSPFNVCLVGEGKAVIELLLERSGR
jgi:hypothetical protein